MAGNNSEADEETPKQLPLSEGEVAVLESYLEQWDSMSGQERNVVWEDATTEAWLKAPAMDAKLLRSRKTVYRKWLQNHGGKKKDAKAPINLGRKWTYQVGRGVSQEEGASEEDRGRDRREARRNRDDEPLHPLSGKNGEFSYREGGGGSD
ncbi:hypothetical protein DFH29DRAFT_1000626 [Suillus ampliporus]|nr:hypothetical protein DFH29DRAFT_1000626 [Suillus ampliporus]